ncbi:MAG: cytochrome C oxidase subunit IV family protein [Halomonas sp.]|nr:cytochrome C oxidase subunit IV family protein [Halomonas sp.]MCC5882762.1 cytochrome C oxidase subunit IV family protein [Halomonas sp.]
MRAMQDAFRDDATRRLLITWAVMMGLTLITMLSARLGGDARLAALPLWSAGLLLATTLFKAHRVLMVYLGLADASPAWRGAFVGMTLATLVLVASGYMMARF